MHPGILSADIEDRGHWSWPSRSFWLFWLRILYNFSLSVRQIVMNLTQTHQICIFRFSRLVLKRVVIDLDLQNHLTISTQNFRKRRSTLLFYTDLGRPRGISRPNVLLFSYIALLEKGFKWQIENVDIVFLYFVWLKIVSWWRHQIETFSALLAICAGNSPVPGEFPVQRPVTRSFDVFFDLPPNKRLSKQSWGWWFETPSRPLQRHRNVVIFNWSIE